MRKFHPIVITLGILICICFVACKKGGSNPTATPVSLAINSLSITSGAYNTTVLINGTGFSATVAQDQVSFNGKPASITSATTTTITAIVPKSAGTGNVTVTVNNNTATGPIFTYQLSATVSTFAGNDNNKTVDGTGINASFNDPLAIATDKNGNVYVADEGDNVIRKITPAGVVTTLAGSGKPGSANGTGTAASFNEPGGLVADNSGNIFVADHENFAIRKITPAGVVTTFAGSGTAVDADGTGTAASFSSVGCIAIDASGNLYVINQNIRKITPDGVVTTLSLISGASSFYTGIVVDALGNFYLSGGQGYNIVKITGNGVASTFAGSGVNGSANGTGTGATFSFVSAIAIDNSGNFVVADAYNEQVRMITPTGVVTTLAGVLNGGGPTTDGAGNVATFYSLAGVAVDPSGIIYVSEANNHRVRKIVVE